MVDNVRDLIKEGEGLSLDLYNCPAGFKTIGYGHNLESNGINQSVADFLLDSDIDDAYAVLCANMGWIVMVDKVRKAVVLDMCFNMGWPKFSGFHRFIHSLENGDYEGAANEMVDSRWYNQVGNRGVKLVKMMRTGDWPE